ncbi:MAG: exodeoxyribonuclease V subunit gamma, partial [Burkholderiaceae bacterium]
KMLAARLLPALLAGGTRAELRALARAGLEYPHGPLGELQLEAELQLLADFAERLRERTAPACLPPVNRRLDFELDGEMWQLQLALSDLRPHGLVRYRYDKASAGDYLAGWLQHLFLNAAGCDGADAVTHWIARDEEFHFEPVADAGAALRQLLLLYRQGLCRPLPFYPQSSWEYMDKNASLSAAQGRWKGSMQGPKGEGRHPAYQLALRGSVAIDAEFERIARLVLEPLRHALKAGKRT